MQYFSIKKGVPGKRSLQKVCLYHLFSFLQDSLCNFPLERTLSRATHFSFEHGWMQAAAPLQGRLGTANLRGVRASQELTHLASTGWLNRFFPLIAKSWKNPAAKEQDRNFRAMRHSNFWCCLLGKLFFYNFCCMFRELCYALLAKTLKYRCQGLLSDTKPTPTKNWCSAQWSGLSENKSCNASKAFNYSSSASDIFCHPTGFH